MRLSKHLDGLSGVVIPGGESTTIAKLMRSYELDDGLREFHRGGGWLWGSCAGAIVLSQEIAGFPDQPRLGLLDIAVARNDYGRQVASFEADLDIGGLDGPFRALFIRAPRILRTGPSVEVRSAWRGEPVFVTGERLFATVFHPELGGDDRVHQMFLRHVARDRLEGRPVRSGKEGVGDSGREASQAPRYIRWCVVGCSPWRSSTATGNPAEPRARACEWRVGRAAAAQAPRGQRTLRSSTEVDLPQLEPPCVEAYAGSRSWCAWR